MKRGTWPQKKIEAAAEQAKRWIGIEEPVLVQWNPRSEVMAAGPVGGTGWHDGRRAITRGERLTLSCYSS